MATFSKEFLSQSTRGKMIAVAASATPGTTIHTTGTSATIKDEVWLYAVNTDTTNRKLTLEVGGTTTADLIEFTVPAESGLYLLMPGLPFTGTGAAGTSIAAFAATGSVINITGFVNRITP